MFRIALWTFGGILGLYLAVKSAYLFESLFTRREVERLINDLKKLEGGEPSAEEALNLIQRYGGRQYDRPAPYKREVFQGGTGPCSDADRSYVLSIGTWNSYRLVQALPFLRQAGLRPWDLYVSLEVKNGKIECISQRLNYWRAEDHLVHANARMIPSFPVEYESGKKYQAHYHIIRAYVHYFEAEILPSASPDERGRAFELSLACVTSLSGCAEPCEVKPLAWRDYIARLEREQPAAAREMNSPRCQQLQK